MPYSFALAALDYYMIMSCCRKMFVGGLSWMSSVDSLRAYFERFGDIDECVIMRDAKTKMTRYVSYDDYCFNSCRLFSGFGFVTFVDPTNVQKVLDVDNHMLDGKKASIYCCCCLLY